VVYAKDNSMQKCGIMVNKDGGRTISEETSAV